MTVILNVIENSLASRVSRNVALTNLLSNFEMELHNAIFDALEYEIRYERKISERRKRNSLDPDYMTGFVPGLDQLRYQLVLDTITALTWKDMCTNGRTFILDSAQYHRQHYVFSACGKELSVYTATLEPIDKQSLNDDILSMKHAKFYDKTKGEIKLYLFILMSKGLAVYSLQNETLNSVYLHELLSTYVGLDVFYLENVVYCTLVKKTKNGSIIPRIFSVSFRDGEVSFTAFGYESFPDATEVRMYSSYSTGIMVLKAPQKLYIYSFDGKTISHHQTLDISDTRIEDFKYFKHGATSFIAIATTTNFYLLQYANRLFEILQKNALADITEILPMSPNTFRDETILLVHGRNSGKGNFLGILLLDALTLNYRTDVGENCSEEKINWNSLPQTLPKNSGSWCLYTSITPDLNNAIAFNKEKRLVIVIPYNIKGNKKVLVLTVDSSLEPVQSPVLEQRMEIKQRLENYSSEIENIRTNVMQIKSDLENVVMKGSSEATLNVMDVHTIVVPQLPVESIPPEQLNPYQSKWATSPDVPVEDLQIKIARLEQLLNDTDDRLQGTLRNGTEETITLNQLSVDGSILIQTLQVENLELTTLNNEDASKIITDLVRKDSDKVIESVKIIPGDLKTDSLKVTSINDILLSDIVNGKEDTEFYGEITIQKNTSILGSMSITGKLNEISVNSLLTSESVYQKLNFQDEAEVQDMRVTGSVDGVTINSDLFSDIILNNSVETTLQLASFDTLTIDGDLTAFSNNISGIDLVELDKNVVRLNRSERIAGIKFFEQDVLVSSSLYLDAINDLATSDLVTKSESITLAGNKIFQGSVNTRVLEVEGEVNGRSLTNVFTLNTDQEISGTTNFIEGFEVQNDLLIGTLNGKNYTALAEKGIHPFLLEQQPVNHEVVFRSNCSVTGTLKVASTINGGDLQQSIEDLAYNDDPNLIISGEKTITSWNVENLQVSGLVNELDLPRQLLTYSTSQDIEGLYTFKNNVSMASLTVNGLINGYNLNDLFEGMVRLHGNQTVGSKLSFTEINVEEELFVNLFINGVSNEDLLINGADQTFTAPQILASPKFSSLHALQNVDLIDGATVNDVDIGEFDVKRVTKTSDQTITGNWTAVSSNFATVIVDTLNDMTPDEWNDVFVQQHSESAQTIEGNIIVEKLSVIGETKTGNYGINNYNLTALSENAADINDVITFPSNIAFDWLAVDSGTVNGTVNGYNLQQIAEDAVFQNEPKIITGTKTVDSLTVIGDVKADFVNGGNLVDMYKHIHLNQTVQTPVQFSGPVKVGHLILPESSVHNGIPSDSLLAPGLQQRVLVGDVIVNSSITIEKLITTSVNDEMWEDVISNLAFVDKTNKFTNLITFNGSFQIENPLNINTLNNVDITNFVNDIVLRNENANITGLKVLRNGLYSEQISASEIQCDVVTPDLLTVMENAIRLDRDEIIERRVIFKDIYVKNNISLHGYINEYSIPDDFITLNTEQEFSEEFTATDLTVTEDIELQDGATVNGVDLSIIGSDTWMVDSSEKLLSTKIFTGHVEFQSDLQVTGLVNNIDFANEVVSLDEDATIYGVPIFHDVHVNDIQVNGLIDGFDIADLNAKALFVDQPINTDAMWKFSSGSVNGHQFLLNNEGTLNTISIKDMQHVLNTTRTNIDRVNADTENVDITYQGVLSWYNALKNAYYKIGYFDMYPILEVNHRITSLTEFQFGSKSYLLVGTEGCSSLAFIRGDGQEYYTNGVIIDGTGSVSKWIWLSNEDAYYLVTLSKITKDCGQLGAQIWSFDPEIPNLISPDHDFGTDVIDIGSMVVDDKEYLYTVGDVMKEWSFVDGNLVNDRILNISPKILETITSHGLKSYLTAWNASSPLDFDVYKRGEDSYDLYRILGVGSVSVVHSFQVKWKSSVVKQYIAIVETPDPSVRGCNGVRIFSVNLASNSTQLETILPACDVRDINSFEIGNMPDYYLVLAERSSLLIYHYEGSSGFVLRFTLPVSNARNVRWISYQSEYFLAVSQLDKIFFFKANVVGEYVRD